ncbi:MBL fold metallo-hydrolase [Caldimonas brevitalea]|uniref:Beta-lactamase n=1 Tax=Caldimonas brevitalea TaxID=413882 RepID=A0A0G3BTT4_9BURK|nr:MBL fold metallo-hydrolase [Caldimonas brevitalea]AKJ31448.1 beta-lactamase [Caldimonas brevitalea]
MTLPADVVVFERGWLSSNNVLLRGSAGEPAVLVDSGYATHASLTLALVEQSLGGQRLGRVFNSHLHSDHCGGNAALQQRYGCEVLVPVAERNAAEAWDDDQLSFKATGQQCPRFSVQGVLVPGSEYQIGTRTWQVLAAAGHDPHAVILYAPEDQLLISADALWENGFGVVFPELDGEDALQEVRATLDVIAGLDVRLVIPGHGQLVFDVDAALERAYRRLAQFQSDPIRHGWYAAKALAKFHLIEVQTIGRDQMMEWLRATPLFGRIHARYFAREHPFSAWCDQLLQALENTGVLKRSRGVLVDI